MTVVCYASSASGNLGKRRLVKLLSEFGKVELTNRYVCVRVESLPLEVHPNMNLRLLFRSGDDWKLAVFNLNLMGGGNSREVLET